MNGPLDGFTDDQLRERLASIARPGLFDGSGGLLGRILHNNTARAQWDAQNAELAAEHRSIILELEKRAASELASRAEEERRSKLEQQMEDAGLGSRNIRALREMKPTDATDGVDRWLAGERTFLVLMGSPGCGKTVGACYAAKKALDSRTSTAFLRAMEGASLGMFGDDSKSKVRQLTSVGLLVLDDLGIEPMNDVWRALLENVIDARYANERRTVITTNLAVADVRPRYGERIADRLRHAGTAVRCADKSMRIETKNGGAQ